MSNGIFPHPTTTPWPPPLSYALLAELRAALLDRNDPRLPELVSPGDRAAYEVAPLEWCLRHQSVGVELVARAIERLRGPEHFRTRG